MAKKKEEKVEKSKETAPTTVKNQSVDQLTIAKQISFRLGLSIADISRVIEEEQKLTMSYVKKGYKVIKKNYLTLEPKLAKGRDIISPLNGKEYHYPDYLRIRVRVGDGFKSYVSGKSKMPLKMCRFVEVDE